MHPPTPRTQRRKRGIASVWLAMSLAPMIGLAGLAVDLGNAAVIHAKLQSYVDAKAIAFLKERFGAPPQRVGLKQFVANAPDGVEASLPGDVGLWDFAATPDQAYDATPPLGGNLPAMAVPAASAVLASFVAPLFFGPIFGIPSVTLSADAVAYAKRRHLVLVQDVSGSMTGTPIAQARTALTSFVNSMFNQDFPGDRVALVQYSTAASSLVALNPLPNNRQALLTAIGNLQASGSTATDQGIIVGQQAFNGAPVNPQIVERIMILVTDGSPNDAGAANNAAANACGQGIQFNLVVIGNPPGPQPATCNGGQRFNTPSAAQINQVMSSILVRQEMFLVD
jgi:uncharacterized protein YegL